MTKDLIRLRETTEKFFKLLPFNDLGEFRLGASRDGDFVVTDVDAGATVPVEADVVENALRFYMGSKDYLKGLKEGVERVAGEPAGFVTADESAASDTWIGVRFIDGSEKDLVQYREPYDPIPGHRFKSLCEIMEAL